MIRWIVVLFLVLAVGGLAQRAFVGDGLASGVVLHGQETAGTRSAPAGNAEPPGTGGEVGIDPPAPAEPAVPGAADILVRFDDTLGDATVEAIVDRVGGEIVDRMMRGRLVQVRVPEATTQEALIDAFSTTDGVRYAEPVQPVSIPPMPDGGLTGTDE